MRVLFSAIIGSATLFVGLGASPSLAQRTPLIMEGKTALYQRVLVRPGTPLVKTPGVLADANAEPLPPLTPLYVYKHLTLNGRNWLEVGKASQGPTDGWMTADRSIAWKQTLTLAFTNPANRPRSLFFREDAALMDLVETTRPGLVADGYRATVRSGEVPPNFPVISMEPSTYVDLAKNFYMLPILDYQDAYFESGFSTQLVKVAAVTASEKAPPMGAPIAPPVRAPAPRVADPAPQIEGPTIAGPKIDGPNIAGPNIPEPAIVAPAILPPMEAIADVDPEEVLKTVKSDFKTGVVFVIDTTSSMGKYIDRTREAVRRVFREMSRSPGGGGISFGLVGYRDNTGAAPGLDYVSKTFVTMKNGRDEQAFIDSVRDVSPADVSSKGFDEDAYAGVYTALQDFDWGNFDGRWVVLITDAGAREGSDPLSKTGRNAAEINRLAQEKGVAISVLHLLTDAGQSNHSSARSQYETLSQVPTGNSSLYFGVNAGDVAVFGQRVDKLASLLSLQANDMKKGDLAKAETAALDQARNDIAARRLAANAAREAQENQARQQRQAAQAAAQTAAAKAAAERANTLAAQQAEIDAFERQVQAAGRAMQLAYLGRQAGTKAPSLFEAWIADRDLADPSIATFSVRVLLSKNQLSDLKSALEAILEAGENTRMSPSEFFNQLQTAAALLSRNPEEVGKAQVKKLADLGVLGEYLDDLPYRSKVMEITEDDWLSWSLGQQREFLDELRSKIRLYEDFNDEVSLWVALDDGRVPGDAVYPVPLIALP